MNTIIVIIILLVKKSIHAAYSAMPEEFESSHKELQNLKLVIESELLSITMFLANITMENGQKKYLWLIRCS